MPTAKHSTTGSDAGDMPASAGTDDNNDAVPSSSSPTSEARLQTPEEHLSRKLAADSLVSQGNRESKTVVSSARSTATRTSIGMEGTLESESAFEAKAAASTAALRKGGSNTSVGGESQPGAYRVGGSNPRLGEEEEKQEPELVGARAKLATDGTVLAGTKIATLSNADKDEEGKYEISGEVQIPEAFVVEDEKENNGHEDATVIPMATATAEVVKTKTVCGVNLPTNTWKLLFGAVFGLLSLIAIIVGSLAGTGKIGGGNGGGANTAAAVADRARPVVLDCPATKLVADDGEMGDKFGRAVAIDNGVAVVGAFRHSDESHRAVDITIGGAAYVYEKMEGGDDKGWTNTAKLLAPDVQFESKFGVAVAVGRAGTLLAIGADSHKTVGAVYLFTKDNNAGSGWIMSGRVDPPLGDDFAGDSFGDSVGIDSDGVTLAIGAGNRGTGGIVRVYTLSEADSDRQITWQHDATLQATKTDSFSDKFGGNLSFRGGALVVGAMKENVFDQVSGAAYVFEQINGTWTLLEKLLPPETETGYGFEFGNAVDVDESAQTIVVGSWKNSSPDGRVEVMGRAYVFVRDGDTWRIQAKLAPEGESVEESRRFGSSVAISGDGSTILVGASRHDDKAGAVFEFIRQGVTWSQVGKIVPPGLYKNNQFGNEMSFDEATGAALIGEFGDTDAGGEDAGAAWLIDIC